MLHRLTDFFVLYPTRHEIDPEGRERYEYPLGKNHSFEVFEQWFGNDRSNPDLAILKFPGTGGRAERSSTHPAEAWQHRKSVVWTVNGPGYGQAKGRATMPGLAPLAQAAYLAMRKRFPDVPMIACGNSLGCTQAIYLAQTEQVDAILVRNPPSLRQLIRRRYGWWNLYMAASLVAMGVPRELCTLANAANCKIPAVFVKSEMDKVVPPLQQDRVFELYAGPKRRLCVPGAGHCDPVTEDLLDDYYANLQWLEQQVFADAKPDAKSAESLQPMA